MGYPKTHIGDNIERGSSPSQRNIKIHDNLTDIQKGEGLIGNENLNGIEGPADRFYMIS